MTDDKTETSNSYDKIKLGIDAHAKWYYVARQLDGATPQLVQKMSFEALGVSNLVVQPQDWDEGGGHDSAWLPIDSTNSDPEPPPRERRA